MIDAYRSIFPDAEIAVWSRTAENAARLAAAADVEVAGDLSSAVARTDVVCTATMSTDPLVHGRWLRPGQHLDLIGGFRIDMREADDDAIHRASIFVDTASTACDVGDIGGPIGSGVLDAGRVTDFTALTSGRFARSSDDEITMFKNAGGAHLDLMVARYMFDRHQSGE